MPMPKRKFTPENPPTGDELRAIRSTLGLTQHEMARRLGVPQSTYGGWESGRRSMTASAIQLITIIRDSSK